jgi:hypothetical protein
METSLRSENLLHDLHVADQALSECISAFMRAGVDCYALYIAKDRLNDEIDNKITGKHSKK